MTEFFAPVLLKWYRLNGRTLPWRLEKDPYRIWLAEVILQQTQVSQGLGFYERFLARFPDVQNLAAASETEVLRAWQGLGYYSRARNLHHTAKFIANDLKGKFPTTYQEIIRLKGVGEYTAAAISSFAFGEPHPVVDGNVYRVLSRIFGVSEPIDTGRGKKVFSELAASLIDRRRPADYNQAIMDFGAMHCRPVNPACESCVFAGGCRARADRNVAALPVRSRRPEVKHRYFNYFLLADKNGRIRVNRRNGNDIWKGLYEFVLLETKGETAPSDMLGSSKVKALAGDRFMLKFVSDKYEHQLTHQRLHARFYVLKTKNVALRSVDFANSAELQKLPFPRLITRFLSEHDLREIL
jgi:A/G-specific adenine glycosylase